MMGTALHLLSRESEMKVNGMCFANTVFFIFNMQINYTLIAPYNSKKTKVEF